jgi:hypothetical protein
MPGCWFNYPWCSHGRAPLFFIESILNKNAFHSFDCGLYNSFCCRYGVFCSSLPSTNYMGFNVNSAMRGNFYLRTNSISPYSNSLSSNIIEGFAKIVFLSIKPNGPILNNREKNKKIHIKY